MCFKIRSIAIIAEGIPENLTRQIIKEADKKGVFVIGPATVGYTYYIYCNYGMQNPYSSIIYKQEHNLYFMINFDYLNINYKA